MNELFLPAAQLGGTVFTVVAFLWYLTTLGKSQVIRDEHEVESKEKLAKSNIVLAKSFQKLSDIVLLNTTELSKNNPTVKKNTGAIVENTDAIKKANGGSGK